MGNAFTAFLNQMLFTVGVIVLFGFLIAVCNKAFYKNMGGFGKSACYITGCIGTPIHELAHALMCLIFGHKIVEIKLFQIDSKDGTLGYVNHSYNKKNLYHNIGNFFIGIAPILVISLVLYLLSLWLVPNMAAEMFSYTKGITTADGIGSVFKAVLFSVGAFFSFANQGKWWIFLLIGVFLTLHMTLSGADIKGAWSGLVFLLLLFLVVDVILALVSVTALDAFTRFWLSAGGYLTSLLILSLIICVIVLLLSYLFRLLFKKRK